MYRIALTGTISVVLLLVAAAIASASGVSYTIGGTNGEYGHALNATGHVGSMYTGDTTTTDDTTTMPGYSETGYNETMASHIGNAADQMREHAEQMEATTSMQTAPGMDPDNGYGMQSENMGTGTGYMDSDDMGYGSDYMEPGNTDNMGSSTNSGMMGR